MEKGEWFTLDERGISWAETMLSLLMVFMIFGSLLPLMHNMQQSLQSKKEQAAAFETLHEGAKDMQATGKMSGERIVNGTLYRWSMHGQLCVSYTGYREESESICLD